MSGGSRKSSVREYLQPTSPVFVSTSPLNSIGKARQKAFLNTRKTAFLSRCTGNSVPSVAPSILLHFVLLQDNEKKKLILEHKFVEFKKNLFRGLIFCIKIIYYWSFFFWTANFSSLRYKHRAWDWKENLLGIRLFVFFINVAPVRKAWTPVVPCDTQVSPSLIGHIFVWANIHVDNVFSLIVHLHRKNVRI